MLTFKIYVGVFSKNFKARMLKLGIHMDNELLYCGIETQGHDSNFASFIHFSFLAYITC